MTLRYPVNSFEVLDGSASSEVEVVLPNALVPGPASLSGADVREVVLYLRPPAQLPPPGLAVLQLSQSLLQPFVLCDRHRPTLAVLGTAAALAHGAAIAKLRVELNHGAKLKRLRVALRASDDLVANVDVECALGEPFAVSRRPRLAQDLPVYKRLTQLE